MPTCFTILSHLFLFSAPADHWRSWDDAHPPSRSAAVSGLQTSRVEPGAGSQAAKTHVSQQKWGWNQEKMWIYGWYSWFLIDQMGHLPRSTRVHGESNRSLMGWEHHLITNYWVTPCRARILKRQNMYTFERFIRRIYLCIMHPHSTLLQAVRWLFPEDSKNDLLFASCCRKRGAETEIEHIRVN